MDDTIHLIVANHLLLSSPSAASLLAFVKLQAIHRPTWLRYRHDRALWERLATLLPRWSLPAHMGLRRRVITGIKLLHGKCIACSAPAPRVFMAFQARFCRRCCLRLLISDYELAWRHGIQPPPRDTAFIVRYCGNVRVRFYLKQHLVLPSPECVKLTYAQVYKFYAEWPGFRLEDVKKVIDRMA
jgi:hypothetical protein